MIAFIQKKMDEGTTFFIVDGPNHKPVKGILDIGPARKVIVQDDDLDKVLTEGEGKVTISKRDTTGGVIATKGKAKTAEEAASNHTVAAAPRRGG